MSTAITTTQLANGGTSEIQPWLRVSLPRRTWLRAFPLGFRREFVRMLGLAWPSILTTLLQFLLQTTSFIMCGHMSKEDLDGVALGNSLINVAGLSIGVGMSTACDTLFSQTYGSRNRKRMGLYLQRSLLLMNCALVPLACLHLNVRPLLLLMRQVPDIAHRAALYMRLFLPGLFFQFNFLVLSRYLQNQSRMHPPMVAAFCGNLFNAGGQYVAIHVLGYGYLASAVLQAASLCLMFILTLAYILLSDVRRETWDGWRLDALRGWSDFVKLSVPGIFLIALEEWSFEIATIVAGTLGEVQLGAQSIIFQLESISYMIPFGMSVAVNIRVGQQLGAMQPVGAAQSYRVGLLMTVVIALVTCNLFVFLRCQLPRLFTSDGEIVSTASHVIPLLGLFQLFDGISAVSCGAIRGTGRQVEGAVLLFVGYYVIGLPVGIPLALLTGLEVTGSWIGLLAGIAVEAAAFCCLVVRFNWTREAERAQERAYGRHWRRRRWQERRQQKCEGNGEEDSEEDGENDKAKASSSLLRASQTEGEFSSLLSGAADSHESQYGAVTTAASPAESQAAADEVTFYSDPEVFCELLLPDTATASETNQGRESRGRRSRRTRRRSLSRRWDGSSALYTGRFYGSARLLDPLPGNEGGSEEEAEGDVEGVEGWSSGQVCRLVAARLALLLCLGGALAGSILLMLRIDDWLADGPPMENSTAASTAVTAVTAAAALL